MDPEEPGLLGNLPRSRPGTRSDKRGSNSSAAAQQPPARRKAAARKPAAAPRKKAPAADKRAPATKQPAPATKKPAPRAKPRPEPVASKSVPPSPTALESAVKVAGAGLRVAEGVTREVLRRLPRP